MQTDRRTDGHTDGHMDTRTDKAATICSPFEEHKNGRMEQL